MPESLPYPRSYYFVPKASTLDQHIRNPMRILLNHWFCFRRSGVGLRLFLTSTPRLLLLVQACYFGEQGT